MTDTNQENITNSENGRWYATVEDKIIRVFDKATGDKLAETESPYSCPYSLKFSTNDEKLCFETCAFYYYAYQDICVWDFRTDNIICSNIAEEHRDALIRISDDLRFAICQDDEKPYFSLWNLATGKIIARLGNFGSDYCDTWLFRDGEYVAASKDQKHFYLWHVCNQALVNELKLKLKAKKIIISNAGLDITDRLGRHHALSFHES